MLAAIKKMYPSTNLYTALWEKKAGQQVNRLLMSDIQRLVVKKKINVIWILSLYL